MGCLPKEYKVPSSTGNYLKLEQGPNVLRILAAPIMGYVGWTEDASGKRPVRRHTEAEFKPGDVIVNDKNKIRHFWAMPVWNYAKARVQVAEFTQSTIQDALYALDNNPKWGAFTDYDICITRKGEGMDTEYAVMPEPKAPMPKEADAAAALVMAHLNVEALYDGGDPFAQVDASVPF